MQIERLSALYIIRIVALAPILGCHPPAPCRIKELKTGSDVINYWYDDQKNMSMISVSDTTNGTKETYKFKRDNEKITKTGDRKEPAVYFLDDKQRISSYSYSSIPDNVFELNFKYDQQGYLTNIEKQRFLDHGGNLFFTNHINIIYDHNNPVKVIDSSVVAPDYSKNGVSGVTIYDIAYYEPHELEFVNESIFATLVSYLPEFTYVAYKESAGKLPNKLIKSIVSKAKNELSFRRDFRYKVDDKGNVIEINISFKDVYGKPAKEVVQLVHQCTN